MDEQDINYINPRPDCHQHNHIHETNFSHNAPYIDLNTRRYDVRGEFTQPFTGIDKIRTSLSYIDYFHNELEGDKITNFLKYRKSRPHRVITSAIRGINRYLGATIFGTG